MGGFLRVDQFDPAAETRVNQYFERRRTVVAFAHVLDLSMGSGTMPLASIGRHEASRDMDAVEGGTIGRFQTATADVLHAFTESLRGHAYLEQAGGGTNKFAYLQPFALPPFGANGLDVRGISELEYLIDWQTNNTDWGNVSSGQHRVYAIVADDVPEVYIPHINQKDLDFSGANDQEDVTFKNNISHLIIEDDGSLQNIRIQRDGQTIADDIPAEDIPLLMDTVNSVDTASSTSVYVMDLLQGPTPLSSLANTVTVEGTASGAGDVDLYAFSLDFANARSEASLQETRTRFRQRIRDRAPNEVPPLPGPNGNGNGGGSIPIEGGNSMPSPEPTIGELSPEQQDRFNAILR